MKKLIYSLIILLLVNKNIKTYENNNEYIPQLEQIDKTELINSQGNLTSDYVNNTDNKIPNKKAIINTVKEYNSASKISAKDMYDPNNLAKENKKIEDSIKKEQSGIDKENKKKNPDKNKIAQQNLKIQTQNSAINAKNTFGMPLRNELMKV
jgi:hypothetical protein